MKKLLEHLFSRLKRIPKRLAGMLGYEEPLPPRMGQDEVALLTRHVPMGGNILEFGAGGSSFFFLSQKIRSLTTVESDSHWLSKLKRNVAIRKRIGKDWFPMYVNIGPVKEWSRPVKTDPAPEWLNYHENVWQRISAEDIDFVLIDGRFRVACFCQAALRCNKETLLFAVHDFWDRPHYHSILEFCEIVDKADTIAILKRKKNMDKQAVERLLDAYRYMAE